MWIFASVDRWEFSWKSRGGGKKKVLNVWFPDVAVKIFLCSGYLIKSSQNCKIKVISTLFQHRHFQHLSRILLFYLSRITEICKKISYVRIFLKARMTSAEQNYGWMQQQKIYNFFFLYIGNHYNFHATQSFCFIYSKTKLSTM